MKNKGSGGNHAITKMLNIAELLLHDNLFDYCTVLMIIQWHEMG